MRARAILAAVLAVAASAVAVPSASAEFSTQREAELQQVFESFAAEAGYPGLVGGVWQKGVGSFTTAIGVSRISPGRPLALGDRFRVGSNTKTFTATLVLQLVSRGKLHLGDSVSEYVRGVPFGNRITLRMLLNHTSGIHDLPLNVAEEVFLRPHRNWNPRQIIRKALRHRRYCAPAECWVYSNTNFLLLGEIVRRVTHLRLRHLYEYRVFDRVEMNASGFAPRRPVTEPAAHGYVGGKHGLRDTTDWDLSWAWTAGGASSTLEDLRRWGPAVSTGRGVLNARMQRKRLRVVATGIAPGVNYGLGIIELPGGSLGAFFGHDGAVPGYDSFVIHSPSSKITFAAIGNTSIEELPVTPTPFGSEGLLFALYPELVEAMEQPAP